MNEVCTALTPCPHMDSLHINDFRLEIVVFSAGVVLGLLLLTWLQERKAKRSSNPYKNYLVSLRNVHEASVRRRTYEKHK